MNTEKTGKKVVVQYT